MREGILHLHGRGRGDQIIQALVQVPKKLGKRQEALLKEFASLEGGKRGNDRQHMAAEEKVRARCPRCGTINLLEGERLSPVLFTEM